MPERWFLIASMTFGFIVMAIGYSGSFGGLFSHQVQQLLQGALNPFRNVSKFSPDVALPLALGLAWIVTDPPWSGSNALEHLRMARTRKIGSALLWFVAIGGLVIAATPFWQGDLYKTGGFTGAPQLLEPSRRMAETCTRQHNTLLAPSRASAITPGAIRPTTSRSPRTRRSSGAI